MSQKKKNAFSSFLTDLLTIPSCPCTARGFLRERIKSVRTCPSSAHTFHGFPAFHSTKTLTLKPSLPLSIMAAALSLTRWEPATPAFFLLEHVYHTSVSKVFLLWVHFSLEYLSDSICTSYSMTYWWSLKTDDLIDDSFHGGSPPQPPTLLVQPINSLFQFSPLPTNVRITKHTFTCLPNTSNKSKSSKTSGNEFWKSPPTAQKTELSTYHIFNAYAWGKCLCKNISNDGNCS